MLKPSPVPPPGRLVCRKDQKVWASLRGDANAIVLDSGDDIFTRLGEADLDAAGFADFANGLFGIGNEIQKDLNELIGVADDGRKVGTRGEVHLDLIAAERVFMKLQGPFNDVLRSMDFSGGKRAGKTPKDFARCARRGGPAGE